MTIKLIETTEATKTTFDVDGTPYMVLQFGEAGIPLYTIFTAELEYEDDGSAESGPHLTCSLGAWSEVGTGVGGHPDPTKTLQDYLDGITDHAAYPGDGSGVPTAVAQAVARTRWDAEANPVTYYADQTPTDLDERRARQTEGRVVCVHKVRWNKQCDQCDRDDFNRRTQGGPTGPDPGGPYGDRTKDEERRAIAHTTPMIARYSGCDGYRMKPRQFKTLEGLARFVGQWAGSGTLCGDIGGGGSYMISQDGVGKVEVEGVNLFDLERAGYFREESK